MRIAVSGNGFVHAPLTSMIEVVQSLGVSFVELGCELDGADVDGVSAARSQLATHGIEAACIAVVGRFAEEDEQRHQRRVCDVIAVAASLGVGLVNTYCAQTEQTTVEAAIDAHVRRLGPCIRAAEKNGITLLMESELTSSAGNPSGTADSVKTLIERANSPNFKVTYEPANLYASGSRRFLEDYETLRPHIAHVHLKDIAPCTSELKRQYPDHRTWQIGDQGYICLPVGVGDVPFDAILQRLRDDGYGGFLTLEPFGSAPPFRSGIDYLRGLSTWEGGSC
jgi:sugar phosphate isomerase/epimerase